MLGAHNGTCSLCAIKRYVNWVQNVARQFGPYLWWAQEN